MIISYKFRKEKNKEINAKTNTKVFYATTKKQENSSEIIEGNKEKRFFFRHKHSKILVPTHQTMKIY